MSKCRCSFREYPSNCFVYLSVCMGSNMQTHYCTYYEFIADFFNRVLYGCLIERQKEAVLVLQAGCSGVAVLFSCQYGAGILHALITLAIVSSQNHSAVTNRCDCHLLMKTVASSTCIGILLYQNIRHGKERQPTVQ